ncbi:FHA domain-containing protein [Olsenella sp. AF16-14LB]|jgi:hypothetical protein|uniref:FHA domain-containing protein n=1 Tax=unclassified Olsenella TaxID=2638792 RepID=UPI000E54A58D|nr:MULTISPECIES: FHA domain-containing protein [unclassified Olsenella]RGU52650.1 FHA domain-containing protein [Olsenella sp. AF16-14LB]RGU83891.1 FHA domain-containing protein [Olsenella sp. AF15-43LB]
MKEYEIKVCPRCGEELFADMHVCYGCLYEFPPAGDAASAASPSTPRDDGPTSDTEALALPGLVEDEPFLWDAGLPPAESGWEDDTLDLSGVGRAAIASPTPSQEAHSSSREVLCWVRTPSMEVRLPIPNEGLVIGRDQTCDVVLRSRAVSRSHVRILPAQDGEEGMRVIDLGATNPAMFSGREVRGEVLVPLGWTVSICGAFVTPVRAEA